MEKCHFIFRGTQVKPRGEVELPSLHSAEDDIDWLWTTCMWKRPREQEARATASCWCCFDGNIGEAKLCFVYNWPGEAEVNSCIFTHIKSQCCLFTADTCMELWTFGVENQLTSETERLWLWTHLCCFPQGPLQNSWSRLWPGAVEQLLLMRYMKNVICGPFSVLTNNQIYRFTISDN